ncbi:MAG: DNA-processing protein DprA, partial [Deltaproteobacteria bacterium]
GVEAYTICPEGVIHAELKAGERAGATLVVHGAANYPSALMDLDDAPPLLWMRGRVKLLNRPLIAVVGARNASSLGLRMTKALSGGLAEAGYVVVSGLARGVDTEAHRAALRSGTLAVLAGGVDVVYPSENTELMAEIASHGLCISEQPMGLQPIARHFPRRNRLVSGVARAVVVVEAAADSGSLITARMALDQGREVMAVPGHPFDSRASGCNMLIRDGAVLVRNATDIIEALGGTAPVVQVELKRAPPAYVTGDISAKIVARLSVSPVPEDQLIRDVGASAEQASAELTQLELEGRVSRHPGGLLTLVA